jgi:hypothetical protein
MDLEEEEMVDYDTSPTDSRIFVSPKPSTEVTPQSNRPSHTSGLLGVSLDSKNEDIN